MTAQIAAALTEDRAEIVHYGDWMIPGSDGIHIRSSILVDASRGKLDRVVGVSEECHPDGAEETETVKDALFHSSSLQVIRSAPDASGESADWIGRLDLGTDRVARVITKLGDPAVDKGCIHIGRKTVLEVRAVRSSESGEKVAVRLRPEPVERIDKGGLQSFLDAIPIPSMLWRYADGTLVLDAYNGMEYANTNGLISGYLGVSVDRFYRDRPDVASVAKRCRDERLGMWVAVEQPTAEVAQLRHLRVYFGYLGPNLILQSSWDETDWVDTESAIRASQDRYRSLYNEVRSSRDLLRELSHQIVETQEKERRRIALELHDEAGALLTSLHLRLNRLRTGKLAGNEDIEAIIATADLLSDEIRGISRRLRPPAIGTRGLSGVILDLIASVEDSGGPDISLEWDQSAIDQLPAKIGLMAYRFVQEGLTNAVRHGGATHVQISGRFDKDFLELTVRDDGSGVSDRDRPFGMEGGLSGLRERVREAEGKVTISSDIGVGTAIFLRIPVQSFIGQSELDPQ